MYIDDECRLCLALKEKFTDGKGIGVQNEQI